MTHLSIYQNPLSTLNEKRRSEIYSDEYHKVYISSGLFSLCRLLQNLPFRRCVLCLFAPCLSRLPQIPKTPIRPLTFLFVGGKTHANLIYGACAAASPMTWPSAKWLVYELEMENTGSRWGVSASMFSANFNCLCLDFSIFFPLCLRPVCTCAKNNKISSLASEFPWKIWWN